MEAVNKGSPAACLSVPDGTRAGPPTRTGPAHRWFIRWTERYHRWGRGGGVVWLRRLRREHVPLAGNKAVTLGELLRAGLPVPDGFVILPDSEHKLGVTNRKAETQNSRALERALAKFPEGQLFAVRSSGSAEDSSGTSFAGQYESFLNVPAADVADKVRRCWLSAFSARAVAYRAARGLPPDAAGIAVLVQQMVPAESAGVLFTADPVSGDARRMIIEGVQGLGDAVAAGQTSPERVVLGKWSLQVLADGQMARAQSTVPLGARPSSGAASHKCSEDAPNGSRSQPLSNVAAAADGRSPDAGQLFANGLPARIGELGLRAERVLGGPLDIEWAAAAGNVYLLQARPITGLASANDWASRQVWSNLNVGEGFPDVTTPLTWSLLQGFFVPLFDSVFRVAGVRPGRYRSVVGLVAGRIYFNVNTGLAALRPFAFALNRIHNIGRALGGGESEVSRRLLESIPDGALPDLGFRWWRFVASWPGLAFVFWRHSPRRGDAWTQWLKRSIDELARNDVRAMSTPELARFFSRLARNGFVHWDLFYLFEQGLALPVFEFACRKWLNDPELTAGYRLFAGLGGVAEAEAGLALWRLAALAHSHPETRTVLESGASWSQSRAMLQATPHGAQFLHAWDTFMAEHGHHCRGELELHNPRWSETPDYILGLVRGYIGSLERLNPVEKQRHLAAERERLTHECRRRLTNPVKRRVFLWALQRSQKVAVNREEWKNQAVRQMTVLRRSLLELGSRLAAQGVLADPDDVFFLEVDELECLLASQIGRDAFHRVPERSPDNKWGAVERVPTILARIAARRKEYETNLALNPPPVVVGRFRPDIPRQAAARRNGNVLEGIAVSPGKVTGRAKVILRNDNSQQVLPGEILVAPFTDPAWTPYFITAAGVVSDQGGILSHGSTVAREYGLPAVTNVGCATQVLRSGMLLEVDGGAGTVTILDG